MESQTATRVMIISDLQLGGTAPSMMSQPQHLAAYIAWLPTVPAADETLELVMAGDVIDFLAIPAYASWTPDSQHACAKLRQTLEGPCAPVFAALAAYLALDHRHRLTILLGNHDLELGLPAVQDMLLQALGGRRHPTPAGEAQAQATTIDDMLRAHFADPQRPGLLLIDESDALVEADAAAGFPLLNRWRSLQAEGVCSFILAGYWYLYLHTLDHSSPVYNFATVYELGPLDAESGRILASEPLTRLGLTYADPEVPVRLVQRTGGYPSPIQLLCDQLLKQLERHRTLVITPEHLTQVEQSPAVLQQLGEFFRMNTGLGTQLAVYQLLESEAFTQEVTHTSLEQATERTVPLPVIQQLLLQLTLYGLVTYSDGAYRWTIPLVRDTLLADPERPYRVQRLRAELPVSFAAWITPQREGTQAG